MAEFAFLHGVRRAVWKRSMWWKCHTVRHHHNYVQLHIRSGSDHAEHNNDCTANGVEPSTSQCGHNPIYSM